MDTALYEMIFKRKSFHLFRGVGDERLTQSELDGIGAAFERTLYADDGGDAALTKTAVYRICT